MNHLSQPKRDALAWYSPLSFFKLLGSSRPLKQQIFQRRSFLVKAPSRALLFLLLRFKCRILFQGTIWNKVKSRATSERRQGEAARTVRQSSGLSSAPSWPFAMLLGHTASSLYLTPRVTALPLCGRLRCTEWAAAAADVAANNL